MTRKNIQILPEPIIPLAFELHDRKLGEDHSMFIYQVRKAIDDKYQEDTRKCYFEFLVSSKPRSYGVWQNPLDWTQCTSLHVGIVLGKIWNSK